MNDILQLKGQFQHSRAKSPGAPELPANQSVSSDKLRRLMGELETALEYWNRQQVDFDPLISVQYRTVVAKSNRVRRLLGSGSKPASESVVGAKFEGDESKPRHVITHCVPVETIKDSIDLLERCAFIVDSDFSGSISSAQLKQVNAGGLRSGAKAITKTTFAQVIRDAHFAEHFFVDTAGSQGSIDEQAIVSLYDTGYGNDLAGFLRKLGLAITPDKVLQDSILLDPDEYSKLVSKYPYLVSMSLHDYSQMTPEEFDIPPMSEGEVEIPEPSGEPIIGVIDTPFDSSVYFSDWVDSRNMIPDEMRIEEKDKVHGTCVTSLIVDGPSINPELDDGCGRFRVRHFGVSLSGRFSSFAIMRCIKEIVEQNRDIKVWNLSLGSDLPVSRNFISPQAALLDELQFDYDDIIFVVAGTNKSSDREAEIIGAPADSINSLVVSATSFSGKQASYSRRGPVLQFFKKPDVCCVGGDHDKAMHVCMPTGEGWKQGTSFAAPWISRKMAYLMQVIGLSREVAKALIIDSAAGWDFTDNPYMGYGMVPTKIEDILHSPNDEIRFLVSEASAGYENYNYNIPVPTAKGGHPFVARATLCYFPKCDRSQGVDYTDTELDLHFGRINDKGRIQPLNKNPQGEEGAMVYEGQARKFYRKWDNVKHIGEQFSDKTRMRAAYGAGLWGIKVRTTERSDEKHGRGLKFGIVVTLKEINGVNRIDDFIQQCSLRGWLVTRIDVQNRIDIYNASDVDVEFDD